MAVDTLFLCFLEDLERNDGTPARYAFNDVTCCMILPIFTLCFAWCYATLLLNAQFVGILFVRPMVKATIKPVYNDHPWFPKIVAVVDRWPLFSGHICNKTCNWDPV
jgi:hypothetical protein